MMLVGKLAMVCVRVRVAIALRMAVRSRRGVETSDPLRRITPPHGVVLVWRR